MAALALSVIAANSPAWGITPDDVFQTGQRAYLLGHWQEAASGFRRFLETWPGHKLQAESNRYLLLSEARAGFAHVQREYEESRLASLTSGLAFLKQKLPEADLTELEVERQVLNSRLFPVNASTPAVLTLLPEQLAHFMKRDVFPAPADDPRGTLTWIHGWKARHGNKAPAPLLATLDLWRAKALWQILLSPLPASRLEPDLKSMGEYPVHGAFIRSLKQAFRNGEPDVKREAALLGVCSAMLASDNRHDLCSIKEWKTYLDDRGNHLEGAWCPR
ncbi:MAG TPA: hypothetical protein PKM25_05640 [Candidatus Ozemobacteraceae bacterium]|nr:hypothetical protein [Candidatus Ozemobacteraceae bacterium]